MNSESSDKPAVPVLQYRTRNSRTGLARRLGFDSVEDVSKNRNKIVNEQKRKLMDMKRMQSSQFPQHGHAGLGSQRNKSHGKNLSSRRIVVDNSWKIKPTKPSSKKKADKQKKLHDPKPKSLDDLDKEMDSYFNKQPEKPQEPSAQQLDQEMDSYMAGK